MTYKNCAVATFVNSGQILFVLTIKKTGIANKYLGE